MKLIGKDSLSRVIEWALVCLMFVIVGLLLTLPWSITWITERTPDDPQGLYMKYLVILTYSGLMAELILWQIRGLMHNVNHNRVFTADTVRRLRIAAVEVLILATFFGLTMFWMSKFFMAFLFVCFVLGGCMLLVVAEIFRQANQYKEENDMTI